MTSTITGILLAAGSGSRFGGGKLLAPLADGSAVGIAAWKNLNRALPDPLVVIRKGDDATRSLFSSVGARMVECADAADGMSKSLIAGIRASASSDGWIIALGDMPYVSPNTITEVASAIESGAQIAMPEFKGSRGHPVGFSAALLTELLEIRGDEGAREVVKRHRDALHIIETRDPGILRDIDTREDLARG